MSKWGATILQVAGLMIFSQQAFASGIPTLALFFPYIPILVYLMCAFIWALKSGVWSAAKRWLFVVVTFPLFAMAAFFIPLLLVRNDKYVDVILFSSSAILTVIVIGVLFWSLAKSRR